MRRPARWLLTLLVLVCGAITGPARVAGADVGAGIGASPVVLAEAAVPGGTYALPSVYVVNTGTDTGRYRMRVQRISPGPGRPVPSSWVRIEKSELILAPKQHSFVPLLLVVPPTARPGHYMSDLVFGTVSTSSAPGAHVGAQAATKLEFDVRAGTSSSWWWVKWFLGGAVVLLVVAALIAAQRRYGFKLRVERRR